MGPLYIETAYIGKIKNVASAYKIRCHIFVSKNMKDFIKYQFFSGKTIIKSKQYCTWLDIATIRKNITQHKLILIYQLISIY